MNRHAKSIVSLTSICAVIAILMAITNYVTGPIIKEQENKAANEALYEVMPSGKDFEKISTEEYELPGTITEVYSESSGGYVFKMETVGYSSGLVIMCGVDKDGKVTGTKCIASSETLGEEATYGEKLLGKTVEDVDGVDTVGGATKTTGAYKNAVKDALNAQIILGGGSVDLRDDAQILKDNLNTALSTKDLDFDSVFITEEIGDITAVYKAVDEKGYVFVLNENFVGTDNEGKVVTANVDATVKTTVETASEKLLKSEVTEIDITKYADMPPQIQKAYKTAGGNYVFDLRAAGFGINGDKWYNPSGEYINIKISATKEGKIIACQTVSQAETEGVGSVCGDESFYTQFNGKTQENYGEIDAISGATITTNGYKSAVSKVFEAITILEGGVE